METFCQACQAAHPGAIEDPAALFGAPMKIVERLTDTPVYLGDGVILLPIDVKARVAEEWMGETPSV